VQLALQWKKLYSLKKKKNKKNTRLLCMLTYLFIYFENELSLLWNFSPFRFFLFFRASMQTSWRIIIIRKFRRLDHLALNGFLCCCCFSSFKSSFITFLSYPPHVYTYLRRLGGLTLHSFLHSFIHSLK
jgi:hypothetical protein